MERKKTILIFGGTGCLGKNLIQRYSEEYQIVNYSRDEHKHWNLDQEIGMGKVTHVIGDAGDKGLVVRTLLRYQPHQIFILHALKHVDRCQENLTACIQTNLLSVKNVLDCIEECRGQLVKLEKVLFTSTDKAPSPINVYGMCKAICEELMIEKSRYLPFKFVVVRYGNVLNSTSSLLPALLKNKTDIYSITDERMTRFWMTIEQACETVHYALEQGESGEVIIPKLKSFYIKDMIEFVATMKGKQVVKMGLRPGERLYETLINDTQSIRTVDKGNGYYHIVPYYKQPVLVEPFVYDSNSDIITDPKELFRELLKIMG